MFASIEPRALHRARVHGTRPVLKKLAAGPIEWTDTGVGPVDEEEESGDFTIVRTKGAFLHQADDAAGGHLQMNACWSMSSMLFLNSEDARMPGRSRRKTRRLRLISDTANKPNSKKEGANAAFIEKAPSAAAAKPQRKGFRLTEITPPPEPSRGENLYFKWQVHIEEPVVLPADAVAVHIGGPSFHQARAAVVGMSQARLHCV